MKSDTEKKITKIENLYYVFSQSKKDSNEPNVTAPTGGYTEESIWFIVKNDN